MVIYTYGTSYYKIICGGSLYYLEQFYFIAIHPNIYVFISKFIFKHTIRKLQENRDTRIQIFLF